MKKQDKQAALEALCEITSWANKGVDTCTRGKTIPDIYALKQVIISAINAPEYSEPVLGGVANWEFFTDGAYWDMCAVRPVGDRDFNSPNLFHVSNLKEGERLAKLLNYLGTSTVQDVNMELLEALKSVDAAAKSSGSIIGFAARVFKLLSKIRPAIARAEQSRKRRVNDG